ncbi:hypothetical protein JCM3766R1_002883 [Sporobolomyces carnicolor]
MTTEPRRVKSSWWSTRERDVVLISTAIKLSLFSAYRSTDFEVHRNWLAVTHSLPLTKWYHDTTSEWTLDYPPFFAYFERVLAKVAYAVDPEIVRLDNLGYSGHACVWFQRSTVVLSELVLVHAVYKWARLETTRRGGIDETTAFAIASSLVLHPGLLIVDHMHFQYNGFLLGILLTSIVFAQENRLYSCAATFAALLHFKHIFVYLAPPFAIFLFRRHCFPSTTTKGRGGFKLDRLVELGLVVVAVSVVSFGPFLIAASSSSSGGGGALSELRQIVARLFPFQRGLNHAYWAANVWALVSATDRVLVKYLVSRGVAIDPTALASSSRGLIGQTSFGVLPDVSPLTTFVATIAFVSLYLAKLWRTPTHSNFVECVVLSAMTSFLWGWHVHEKAVLLFLVPLSLLATKDDNHFRAYRIATVAGVYSLFPLLINAAETPIKIIFSTVWFALVFPQLRRVVYRPLPTNVFQVLIDKCETFYLVGFVFVQLYTSILHPLYFSNNNDNNRGGGEGGDGSSWEFLPLMLTSVYCAVGIVTSWIRLSWGYFFL